MSKRPRAAAGTSAGKRTAAVPEPVEVINLLRDSSQSEDDPDDAAVQQAQPPPATRATVRPTKRLRRMDAQDKPIQQLQRDSVAARAGQASALPVGPKAARRKLPAEEPPASEPAAPKPLRQGTRPIATLRPRTTALPLQTLNVSRPRAASVATPTASGDSALAGVFANAGRGGAGGGAEASPAPSPSPSFSRRSSRLSEEPDFMPMHPSQPQSQGGTFQPSSQRQPEPLRPQLRQLIFAPARNSGDSAAAAAAAAAAAGKRGTKPPTATKHGFEGSGGGDGTAAAEQPSAQIAAPVGRALRVPSGSAPFSSAALPSTSAFRSSPPSCAAAVAAAKPLAEMWHERHTPRTEEDLVQVLHRKKVSEVKEWLERQHHMLTTHGSSQGPTIPTQQQQSFAYGTQQHAGPSWQSRQFSQTWPVGGFGAAAGTVGSRLWQGSRALPCGLAVLSGPAGCGKSTCLRVLAEATGFEVVEWTPPAPMMWNEYQYQRSAAGPEYGGGPPASYQSKLDDFESFVSRSKYPSLALTSTGAAALVSGESASGRAAPGGSQQTGAVTTHRSATAPGSCGGAPRPKLLLVEDLPHTHDTERRLRLASALRDLAATARGPVVLVATEVEGQATGGGERGGGGGGAPDGGGSMGGAKGLHKDILAALQAAGATAISFNPVTANNIAKLLMRVAAAEGHELMPATAMGLAEAADGDVRSALQALQMNAMLQKAARRGATAASGGRGGTSGSRRSKKGNGKVTAASATAQLRVGRQQALTPGEVARLAAAQRDLGLPLFHALGKFLHNKRSAGGNATQGGAGGGAGDGDGDSDGVYEGGGGGGSKGNKDKDSMALRQLNAYSLTMGRQWKLQHPVQLPARLLRPPMRYDPEAILLRCGLEAPVLLSFLHENYLGFVGGEAKGAVEDMTTVATFLSDSAVLCGQSRSASATAATTAGGGTSLWLEDSPAAANLSSAIAASVAARGLMYGNTHPVAHKFNPIRAPASSAIDQAAAANRLQLRAAACRLAAATAGPAGADFGSATSGSALFGGSSASQLVSAVIPWLRALVQISPYHAVWIAPLLPCNWSYYWNGAVTEGAFLRHVTTLPPPLQQQQCQQQVGRWESGGGVGGVAGGRDGWRGGSVQPGAGGGGDGAVEGMLEQLGIEDEDPIEG
ncbi:hypothetical protein VOLCADRAFT_107059 [Volvox carteri f. nagariensis]|uniref:Uncharacterized protein n=1 Tax=Volvox carteri f. nagariensis TaxID=3068 RepID=D8UBR5_VOLCA|nr:uncharacterized protein VOLCADRAFT_107059 [Volvox carteri f. nagariensis]EFJ42812.1 hypothetical protein VOLCADRAFT_107059 [Volvox carteri f. nagariensis]|eukprot:XP_002956072.1 hypothetical protein VOLCADRAFT_107059 [Volvox carteri f. nagariensis]